MIFFVTLQSNFNTNEITFIMKKFLLLGITLMVSAAMLMIACKKDEPSKNNTETTDTDYVDLGLPSGTKWKSTRKGTK